MPAAIAGLGVAVVLAVRLRHNRRRAALHARHLRMRARAGLPPLTPPEVEPPRRPRR